LPGTVDDIQDLIDDDVVVIEKTKSGSCADLGEEFVGRDNIQSLLQQDIQVFSLGVALTTSTWLDKADDSILEHSSDLTQKGDDHQIPLVALERPEDFCGLSCSAWSVDDPHLMRLR